MPLENKDGPVPLIAIHINLEDPSIVFVAADLSATKLTYSPQGLLYELISKPHAGDRPSETVVEQSAVQRVASADQAPAPARQEKTPTAVLPGKLQTRPKEGNLDRQGKPTAWAQFLAHVEGRDGATLLSTSFHGRTRDIALALQAGDHLTAQGYLHLRRVDEPEGRLSTFSVIHVLEYPGKPAKSQSS